MALVTDPEREVRFGLVLYGGVSLAIYIYGVAYEFQRLVRASTGEEVNAWTEVLKAANVSATVDIVSGASAGGINGLLLGKALAEGGDLRAVRSLWIDQADLGRLLHDAGEKGPKSLLRSERFAELIGEGLAGMDQQSLNRPLVSVFDLFVAATRIRPWVRDVRTDLGGSIQTSTYRKSFNLKYRRKGYNPADPGVGYERNDFSAGLNPMLAELARATSAFPVAFEPVAIKVDTENEHLFDQGEPSGYFSDGGILHNKPFTETISTILTRAAGTPVRRWLVSVEPDPEHALPPLPEAPPPEVPEVASKAVVGIPRYQSIAADLARVEEHRARVTKARERLAGIDRALLRRLEERERLSQEGLERWRDEVLAASDYRGERRRQAAAALAERLTYHWPEPRDRGVADWVRELSNEVGAVEGADADFERRRIQHLLEMLRPLLREQPADSLGRRELARRQLEFWAQLDRVDDALWRIFEEADRRIEPGDDQVVIIARARELTGELAESLAAVRERTRQTCEELDAILAELGANRERRLFSLVFNWFVLWDAQLLTIAELTDSAARDEILLARISPGDARFIQKPPADKLAGDALGHFGGFLKREWRANDVLWGRLDAAETISRILFHDVATGGPALEAQIRRAQAEIVREEIPDLEGDYRHHMENEHEVGAESLEAVPMEDRANLSLQAADVLRNMFAGLGEGSGGKTMRKGFAGLAKALGLLLLLVRWPIRAIWGRDPAWRRVASLGILFLALWAIAAILLVILGVIGSTSTLWFLIAAALGITVIWSLLQAYSR